MGDSKRVHVPAKARNIEDVISLILDRHVAGLLVLLGDEPWPDTEELYAIVSSMHSKDELGVRVRGGRQIPKAQMILEHVEWIQNAVRNVGGIGRINEVFRDLKAHSQRNWSILKDSCKVKRGRPFYCTDFTAKKIAEKYYVHEDTMRRNRNFIVQQVAVEIAYPGLSQLASAGVN